MAELDAMEKAASLMYEALNAIYEELDNRYDGAPDSTTRWMGEYLDQIATAIRRADGKQS